MHLHLRLSMGNGRLAISANSDDRLPVCHRGASGLGVSVSTQADIAHSAKGYESEDENAGRKRQRASDDRPPSKTNMYSKQEFREQYCINNKQLDLLELEKSKKDRFLGCLSQYHIESPCSRANRASFLSVCVRRRVPSDENLNTDYAPIQRYPSFGQPSPAPAELCAHDSELECSYFRRRPRSVCSQPDPKRYTWMPEDEDFTRMEWPQSVIEDNAGWPQNYNVDQIASVSRGGSLPRPPTMIPCPAHTPIPPPPPPPPLTIPPHRTKHVSFARSHTLTTFDDSVMPAAVSGGRYRRDCERLIDGRTVKPESKPYAALPVIFQPFAPYPQYIAAQNAPAMHYPPPMGPMPTHPIVPPQRPQQEQPKVVVLDSIKKGVMRTQATQTEVCLGRKPLPPNYLSLSPRTIKRVKMVAAGVQTNGYTVGVRRLTKSFSEVGGDRLLGRETQNEINATLESFINHDHEKLHRTQSEEPPRSPRSPTSVTPSSPLLQRGDSDDVTSASIKSVASSQVDKSSELSALQRQAQEYFQQNFQFIHESDRDDTIDDDIDNIEKSMALNRRNLEYLQQEIAKQTKAERSLKSILSKSTSDASQKTMTTSHPLSKTSTFQSEPSTETSATTTDDSEKNEKEIIIDFEPRPDDEAIPFTTLRRKNKRMLQKTMSEGEILLDVRKNEINSSSEGIKDAPIIMSTSQENMTREDRERDAMYKQYIGQNYNQTPIKDEGIFAFEPDGSFSSSDGNAPYEDFHEKYISYKHEPFRIRSVSFEEQTDTIIRDEMPSPSTAKSSPGSPDPVHIDNELEQKTKRAVITNKVTTILAPLESTSPCASNESLTIDHSRDHSDGLWNESQTTVLQVDSGTDNGTVISSSDLSSLAASPGALALLTPTSRRKQLLLLQHQQRSSLDTDALDEEFDASQSQSPTSPRTKLDACSINSTQQMRVSLSPPAVVPNVMLPITKQPMLSKTPSPTGLPKPSHTPAIAITHPSLDLSDIPFKRTPSFINKKRERALSPSRRRDLQKKAQQKEPNGSIPKQIMESPSEPILTKTGSSETSLARTDSGRLNTTDLSESTTTTEDYVTANSDSSKKSNSKNQNSHPENNKTQEGSSFESASSLYSSTKTDNVAEDLIVPSFSPPLQISDDFIVPDLSSPPLTLTDKISKPSVERFEVKADINHTAPPIRREKTEIIKSKEELSKASTTTRGTVSGKSSSSGSYSIGGSNPNVTESVENKIANEKSKKLHDVTETKEVLKPKEDQKNKQDQREQLVPKMTGSLSDDERSAHYSSSGYYESPVEDEDDGGLTYKHSQKYRSNNRQKSWLTDDKKRKKRAFTLEFSKSCDDSISTSQDDWVRKDKDIEFNSRSERNAHKPPISKSPLEEKGLEFRKKKTQFVEKNKTLQSSPKEPIDIDKGLKEKTMKDKETESRRPVERERYVKRTKLKAKSPTQNKNIDGIHGHRPQHYDRREGLGSNMKLHLNIPTSDDSSEQYRKDRIGNGNISPRKHRRLRDSPRRKNGPNSILAKSPTSGNSHVYRPRRKSGSNESISLPGSLPRRKQSITTIPCVSSLEAEDIETTRTLANAGSRLTPLRYVKSPTTSPRHHRKQDKEGKFAKAASAESLRSVSPGSDSVFYSEQTEHSVVAADGEAKAHCLHCGKEVHIVTATHDHDSRASRTSHTDESYADATPDIVPAPAGFADSPSCVPSKKPASGARLYKKLDKRYRSEDKSRHHYRHRQDVRAKSEERGKEEYASTEKPQDTRIARSAGNSLDKLGGSNASVDPDEHEECSGSSEGAENSREEKGVYAAPWWCGNWIMLSENDDHWTRIPPDLIDTTDSCHEDPTESEVEFNKRYVALTHRLVHRRACIELNKRQADNSFVRDMLASSSGSLRQKLEEIFKLMLVLWCRQTQINKLVAAETCESDKTVVVRRGNEEFGFRIHGSKPVVVSAIEPDTPAETSGLEVGDIVIAVNGINVLVKTHSEVVKIAHSGSEILELEVARTCDVVASLAHEGGAALYSGYLWRAAPRPHQPHQPAPPPRWTRRWFVLKRDNCLYYYKTDSSIHPVGALMLVNYQLTEEDAGRPFGFRLQRGGGARLQLAADTAEASARWRAVLAHAIDASNQRDGWLEVTMRNMKLPPSSILRPDCFGYLMKLGSKWKSWAKRYCVLKDACLYFYNDGNSKSAFGMACLHGYRVQSCATGGKKYAFEVMPTETKQRHFYFHTESEMDRKRWMAALEYSIDRWMKAG
ncbi:Regulator of G-protein signaling 12 [Papilio machaon]|uniref:Regulator of G-protein signaling 12 n=1 Tax=Papilio machaon TaxID=76193 RepID=A0A0N0PDA6_PAPMA|nr:Regulator of G-protein signaling 12 [Papilio machaon]